MFPRSSTSPRRQRRGCRDTFVCVGGHSASFTAEAMLAHGDGAIDCVLKGEGEAAMPLLLAAIEAGGDIGEVPGVVTADGRGAAAAASSNRSTS